jgi:hypothetical protein
MPMAIVGMTGMIILNSLGLRKRFLYILRPKFGEGAWKSELMRLDIDVLYIGYSD